MVIINGLPSDTISTFLPRWSIEQQIGPTKLLSIQFVKCLYSQESSCSDIQLQMTLELSHEYYITQRLLYRITDFLSDVAGFSIGVFAICAFLVKLVTF